MGATVVVLRRKIGRRRKEREAYLQDTFFDGIQVHLNSCGYNDNGTLLNNWGKAKAYTRITGPLRIESRSLRLWRRRALIEYNNDTYIQISFGFE
jgi:hypothetical protein